MADFDKQAAQDFQNRVVTRIREMERMLDKEIISYYQNDSVDSQEDATENLRGMHNYIRMAYRELDAILTEIERRPDYRA